MIFKFEPQYMERVWGGTSFKDILGRNTGDLKNLGESWDIVDRKDHQSKLSNTEAKGTKLRALLLENHHLIMGPTWEKERPFPILVKWLECRERLSLQVHPPSKIANKLGGEPKTENWYIAHATTDAGLFIGLKKGTTKDLFTQALKNGSAESHCHRVNSHAGQSILVESGRLHAIDKGNLILEIQQNSDTTYRAYDWGRVGLDGKPRELHLKNSLQCVDFNDFEPSPLLQDQSKVKTLADCPHFRIRKFNAKANENINLKEKNQDCLLLNPIGCKVIVGKETVKSGSLALSPYSESCEVTFKTDGQLLVTDHFTQFDKK